MKLHINNIDELNISKSILTIGSFDGVHFGHLALVNKLNQLAQLKGGQSVIITFEPHPRTVLLPKDHSFRVLSTLEEKVELLSKTGLNHLVVVPFDTFFSGQSADDYLEYFLLKKFNPIALLVGYDHRFGKDKSGDIHVMKKKFEPLNIDVLELDAVMMNEIAISSTKVRKFLFNGEIKNVQNALGHTYLIIGKVKKGDQIGRTLGFPTANIAVDFELKAMPNDGIYFIQAEFDDKCLNGCAYIGHRPAIGQNLNRVLEIYFLDFTDNIYDKQLNIKILDKLRDDLKFDSLDQMVHQMNKDKFQTEQYFNNLIIHE